MVRVQSFGAVVLVSALAGCAQLRAPTPEPHARPATGTMSAQRELTTHEQIVHALSRLTFGARPGDAQRVAALGVDRWIDQQLRPTTIDDDFVDIALRPFPFWTEPTAIVPSLEMPGTTVMSGSRDTTFIRDSAGKVTRVSISYGNISITRPLAAASLFPSDQLSAGKIIRAATSERQLLELITEFWENHFSLYSGKIPSRHALVVWDREVIRPHAFGKFRELLGAVAHSPAMMYYLDNFANAKLGLNENYARELLELHTLGVDGGYTQEDVIQIARAFTGWTVNPAPRVNSDIGAFPFKFLAIVHDSSQKQVLGHTLAAGRGIEDGEQVLDIIARHPSTARFISLKLARRLVSDVPPAELVDRAAATFMRTDGDIAEVIRTIVTSAEFFSRAAFRAKVKTPFELVVATHRAFGLPTDTSATTARLIAGLGQPSFGRQTPDGWPDRADTWINAGAIKRRVVFATDFADGRLPLLPLSSSDTWSRFALESADNQANAVIQLLFGGIVGTETRDFLRATTGEPEARLREMIAIAIASPEFQRR